MKQLKRNNRMCDTIRLKKKDLDVDADSGFLKSFSREKNSKTRTKAFKQ